jgi:hypothetical protein
MFLHGSQRGQSKMRRNAHRTWLGLCGCIGALGTGVPVVPVEPMALRTDATAAGGGPGVRAEGAATFDGLAAAGPALGRIVDARWTGLPYASAFVGALRA